MDDDLARRLAALRHSFEMPNTTSKAPVISTRSQVDKEDALAIRFNKIFNRQHTPRANTINSKGKASESDKETLSLPGLIDIPSSDKDLRRFEEVEETEIIELLVKAKAVRPIHERSTEKKKKIRDQEAALGWIEYDPLAFIEFDINAERDILRIVKDEIDFEATHGVALTTDDEADESEANNASEDQKLKNADTDENLFKRFKALGGVELPLVQIMEPEGKSNAKPFVVATDEVDADTWCCICNDDAEYRCSGCENDIYCPNCLYETHTGLSAGHEERRHKWTKYTKPKKLMTF